MPDRSFTEARQRYLPLDRRSAARFIADWEATVRAQLNRMGAETDDGQESAAGLIAAGADPAVLLGHKEEARLVRIALSRLDPRDREIIALRYLEDWKLAEIADRLELPPGSVKTWIHRAHKRLRLELDHE
ncbi:MAG: sigma-70 family RNA polymerase sigma factor [bacterium]|nr:sigma-70 family RNA polymerase sigma factor [bacterium]